MRRFHFLVVPWQRKLVDRGWRSDINTLIRIFDPSRALSTATKAITGSSLEQTFAPSGTDTPAASPAAPAAAAATEIGAVNDVGSIEAQASQRKLARLSRYFTTPSGVLGDNTGSSGVF